MAKRWTTRVEYCAKQGARRVWVFGIDELSELSQRIEEGPDFNELVDIRITYNFTKGKTDG